MSSQLSFDDKHPDRAEMDGQSILGEYKHMELNVPDKDADFYVEAVANSLGVSKATVRLATRQYRIQKKYRERPIYDVKERYFATVAQRIILDKLYELNIKPPMDKMIIIDLDGQLSLVSKKGE